MDLTIALDPHKLSLQATINHLGPSMYSSHYSTSINCKKEVYCNDSKITEFEMIDKKFLYCICSNISVDYGMVFGLEQGDGSVIL